MHSTTQFRGAVWRSPSDGPAAWLDGRDGLDSGVRVFAAQQVVDGPPSRPEKLGAMAMIAIQNVPVPGTEWTPVSAPEYRITTLGVVAAM